MKLSLLRGLLVLCLLFPIAASAQQPFSDIFVFGDSLSDSGNLAALPRFGFLNEPPYDQGFSNGDRAVEVLAHDLGLALEPSLHLLGPAAGTNYAIAGARARGITPIDLKAQLAAFLLNYGGAAPSDALYIVFIGGNDVRDARDQPDEVTAQGIVRDAVGAIGVSVRALITTGAKAIAIINVPNIGLIPETRQLGIAGIAARATRLTTQFNALLAASVHQIEAEHSLNLIDFNLFQYFSFVINNNIALGFSNDTAGCYSSAAMMFNAGCASGANFDQFVFFDEFHPSARMHERVARALFAVVPDGINIAP
ncbi:MAG TPA: SGNH/GDSL hydrolase family protein [Gammaproteobacteria bacterium]|nr:SGNH/GDSL hydrolase family protein [Gammaproteobacteria bacterium]